MGSWRYWSLEAWERGSSQPGSLGAWEPGSLEVFSKEFYRLCRAWFSFLAAYGAHPAVKCFMTVLWKKQRAKKRLALAAHLQRGCKEILQHNGQNQQISSLITVHSSEILSLEYSNLN